MTENDVLLEVDNLTFFYDDLKALDRVSFTVKRGQVVALAGPNGSGKSTLLRCLAALDFPIMGKIQVAGIDTYDSPRECHKRIGFLPDFFGLDRELTVWQSLAWAGLINKIARSRIDSVLEELASELGLIDKLTSPVGGLSRGMWQRVGIGQVLIKEPDLVLLDEPASGLDPDSRRELGRLIRKLNQRGVTFLVTSHILTELEEYASNLMVLKNGRLLEASDNLNQAGESRQVIRIRTLASQIEKLADSLRSKGFDVKFDGISNELSLEFQGEDEQVAKLLADLVKGDFKITKFETEEATLSDRYFELLDQIERLPQNRDGRDG